MGGGNPRAIPTGAGTRALAQLREEEPGRGPVELEPWIRLRQTNNLGNYNQGVRATANAAHKPWRKNAHAEPAKGVESYIPHVKGQRKQSRRGIQAGGNQAEQIAPFYPRWFRPEVVSPNEIGRPMAAQIRIARQTVCQRVKCPRRRSRPCARRQKLPK